MSGLLHAGSMLMLCGLVPIGVHPVLPLLAVLFYAAFAVFVFCKYPIDNRVERLTLIVTHPAYWLMTFPAFLNAVKRMLLGQTGWLKSPHKPYLWTPESGVKN